MENTGALLASALFSPDDASSDQSLPEDQQQLQQQEEQKVVTQQQQQQQQQQLARFEQTSAVQQQFQQTTAEKVQLQQQSAKRQGFRFSVFVHWAEDLPFPENAIAKGYQCICRTTPTNSKLSRILSSSSRVSTDFQHPDHHVPKAVYWDQELIFPLVLSKVKPKRSDRTKPWNWAVSDAVDFAPKFVRIEVIVAAPRDQIQSEANNGNNPHEGFLTGMKNHLARGNSKMQKVSRFFCLIDFAQFANARVTRKFFLAPANARDKAVNNVNATTEESLPALKLTICGTWEEDLALQSVYSGSMVQSNELLSTFEDQLQQPSQHQQSNSTMSRIESEKDKKKRRVSTASSRRHHHQERFEAEDELKYMGSSPIRENPDGTLQIGDLDDDDDDDDVILEDDDDLDTGLKRKQSLAKLAKDCVIL